MWERAEDGATLVFPNLQISGAALTNRLECLCKKLGIVIWDKPWINIRASAEADILKTMPINEAAAILGHSPSTALKHYNRYAKELRAIAQGRALRLPNLDWHPKRQNTSQGLAASFYEDKTRKTPRKSPQGIAVVLPEGIEPSTY